MKKNTVPSALLFLALLAFVLSPARALPADEPPREIITQKGRFCSENVGLGLLHLSSESPLQSLRLALVPRTPDNLGKGRFDMELNLALANVWTYKKDWFLLDYEMVHTNLAARYGITDSLLVEVAFDDRRAWGGILDGFISDFHETFNIDQNLRDVYPNGQTVVDIRDGHDRQLVYWGGGSAAYSQGISMTLQQNLACGGTYAPAVALALTTRYNFWDIEGMGYDSPLDLGVSLALSKRMGPFYLYLSPGFIWYGSRQVQEVELKRTQMSGLAGLEWHFNEKMSLVLQYLVLEGAARDLREFSDASHEITLGWKGEIVENTLLSIGLIENIIVYENSPDFGVYAGVSHRF